MEILPEVFLSDFDESMLSDEERDIGVAAAAQIEPTAASVPVQGATEASIKPPAVNHAAGIATANTTSASTSEPKGLLGPNRPIMSCRMCPQAHPLYKCATFKRMPLERRLRNVVFFRYCYNCLRPDHQSKACPVRQGCQQCGDRHHTLLHSRSRTTTRAQSVPSKASPRDSNHQHQSMAVRSSSSNLSARDSHCPSETVTIRHLPIGRIVNIAPTVLIRLCSATSNIPVRALLDPCCRISQVCESLVRTLRLPTTQIGDDLYCDIVITSSYDSTRTYYLTARVAVLTCGVTPALSVSPAVGESFVGLQLADPTFYRSGAVAIILGPEIYYKILVPRIISQPGVPTAQYTSFGWVISGPVYP